MISVSPHYTYIPFCVTDSMNVLKHWAMCGGEDSSPTYYAIQLHWKCEDEAAQFIHDKLRLDWAKGGGGLTVRRQLPT